MNKVFAAYMVLAIVIFSGCNRKVRNIFRNDLTVDTFKYEYLSAKAKIKYDDGDKSFTAGANIRMQEDSVIWISVSPGLGVEAARMKVTTDSVYFIDRLSKRYFVESFEQLSERYGFDFNFNLLESVLVGNLIYPYARENVVKYETGVGYVQNKENILFENFIGGQTRKLERLTVTDIESNSSISVNYGEFELVGEKVFPFEINASLEYVNKEEEEQTTEINIGYNKAQIEEKPLRFPFNVPSRYSAM